MSQCHAIAGRAPRDQCPPAVVSPHVPGEVALAVQAVGDLLVHQPPALLRPQLLLKLQRVRLLPQSVFVPADAHAQSCTPRNMVRIWGGGEIYITVFKCSMLLKKTFFVDLIRKIQM